MQHLVLARLAELGDASGPMPALQAVRAAEGLISFETLRAIARGEHGGKLRPRTAEGLAKALRIPVAEVYQAAGMQAPHGEWRLPPRLEQLRPRDRALVEDVATAIIEAYERGRREASDG